MKKTILIIIAVFFCFTSQGFTEDLQGLSQQAMESVQQQTQEMSALGIPEAQAKKMLTLMVQNNFQKQNRILAQQVVMAAARAGLPSEPVMSKAMEGMAKQAKEQHILAAMEAVRNRYTYASKAARSLSQDKKNIKTLTTDIADSMAAGMNPEDIEAVMAQLQVRTQTRQSTKNKAADDNLAIQTMMAARTMAQLGTRSSEVSETLCQELQYQYSHQKMQQFRQQFASQHAGSTGETGKTGNSNSNGSGTSGSSSGNSNSNGSANSGSSGADSNGSDTGGGGSSSGNASNGGSGNGNGGSGKGK